MKYARIVDNKVEELFPTLPDFHPDFVATLVEVADAVEVGMVREQDGTFVNSTPDPKPVILAKLAELDRFVPRSVEEIYAALSSTLDLGLSEINIERISRKSALRLQLAQLI